MDSGSWYPVHKIRIRSEPATVTHSRLLFSLPSSALPKSLNQSLNLINSSFLFNINPLFSSPSLYRICFSLSRPTCRRPSALPIGCHLASRTVLTTPYCHLVSIFYCSNLPIGFLCCVAESLSAGASVFFNFNH
ncbi:hypothetical protein MANES_01G247604v8 [Manihot esculenta]|uniref:Uncharacterized protein n=1 Tax=Manihot esculenta TaxID=3983 RepID=A0ACB7IFR7_MANES|nr:hypothetical protein MANES_01G247604v8 [Manihot esculenta]